MDFLLVVIDLFSLGVTAEALRANIGSKSAISLERVPVEPKFQVEMVAPRATTIYVLRKLGCDLVWYKNLDRTCFRFVTMHAFDRRQTDRRLSPH